MTFGWKTRIGLVLSAVWLCLIFLAVDDARHIGQALGFGILPLIVLWGVVWALAGWRAQRPRESTSPDASVLEARQRRTLLIRTVVSVIFLLGLGLFAATWQFHSAGNETGGNAIPLWFGEWLVFGLVAYAVLRYTPKIPPGFPAILATLLIVCGVNYKAYSTISQDKDALESLAKAAPLINKIQSGTAVTDQEIRSANVGMLEPLVLAQGVYTRDVLALAATYQKAISGLQFEQMLTPTSLASPSIRAQTRAKLKLWRQVISEYKTQLDSANARGKLGIQAAQLLMPPAMGETPARGFDEWTAQLNAYVSALAVTEQETSGIITAMLDLMDANSGRYAVEKGPPANLLFQDEATLGRYRALMGEVIAASQREADAQARMVNAQSERADKLTNLLKR